MAIEIITYDDIGTGDPAITSDQVNSYETLANVKEYLNDFFVSSSFTLPMKVDPNDPNAMVVDDVPIMKATIQATQMVDGIGDTDERWIGEAIPGQRRAWPRKDAGYDNEIPPQLKEAQSVMTYYILSGKIDASTDIHTIVDTTKIVKSIKADVVDIEFADHTDVNSTNTRNTFSYIEEILASLLKPKLDSSMDHTTKSIGLYIIGD